MTRDEIISMAREAGFMPAHDNRVELFAQLIAAAERKRISNACAQLPFGDTAHSFAVWIREQ